MKGIFSQYDVMDHQKEWDGNTRRLVEGRLRTAGQPSFFQATEYKTLLAAAHRILAEDDADLIGRACSQLDHGFARGEGSGYHEEQLPPTSVLLKRGLNNLDATAKQLHGKSFHELPPDVRDNLLEQVSQGALTAHGWDSVPPKKFFSKLRANLIDFFFSQPEIWSEIGYGGPAYPRGYVRVELGLLDPWEPIADQERVDARRQAGLGPAQAKRLENEHPQGETAYAAKEEGHND